MKELKKQFRKKGELFTQLFKNETVVVYGRGTEKNPIIEFEVFKYKIHKPDIFNTEDYEKYPSDTNFGQWAWSCIDYDAIKYVLTANHKPLKMSESEADEIIAQIRTEVGGVYAYSPSEV